ncbi:TrkH family potassium uptake protein [Algivirga pacifica]|uniref:TrkH family potassium uptake protein n=1 Tax=Algivirga pacifica TaxID=1162670 RepID=A0ABP9DBB7_9BACT
MRKTKLFNYHLIISIIGILLVINSMFMLFCLPFSLYYNEDNWVAITAAALINGIIGGGSFYYSQKKSPSKDLKKKDGYLIVTLGWIFISFFGGLPYLLSGDIPSLTDAFFETLSGYSTTGASVLTDIEAVGKGILLWRSLTQWIGGMGIIVLTVAILPILGIGGMQLFVAEAPGISPDKLQPRIKETAKRLWWVYLGLTFTEMILLMIGDMSFYDALNHALTTMATGGFSTKNSSAAAMSPFIQYVIIIFMFIAGTNFTLNYYLFKGRFKDILKNEEFKYYASIVGGSTLLLSCIVFFALSTEGGKDFWEVIYAEWGSSIVLLERAEKSFRDVLFQVISIITTTGYVSADYTGWTTFATMWIFVLMFIGGMAGSTAGGVKIVRHIILQKNSFLELKRQLHPSAIIPVRFNHMAVSQSITYNVLGFIIAYFLTYALGILVMAAMGLDLLTAMGSVATCLGNIGPGLGTVGPVDNFAHLPDGAKWFLSFMMLLGRLELTTVIIIFTPYFWKKV